MEKKAEFFNVWRDVLVPEGTMERITALCDAVKLQDSPEGRAARFLRHEIDTGLLYYPNWHEVDDDGSKGSPIEGNTYYCVDEDNNGFLAQYVGKDDNGKQMWLIYRNAAMRVHPTYWCKLPHTPYDDLRDPLRAD